jgi:hypothetical protein
MRELGKVMGHENKFCLAFLNLNEEVPSGEMFRYFTKGNALKILKKMTDQDFGYDVQAWRDWITEHRPGVLPEKNISDYSQANLQNASNENNSVLAVSYLHYLESEFGSLETERLLEALDQSKLELEAHALRTYLVNGSGSQCNLKSWGNRSCIVSVDLPENAEPGDLWFDPVELNLAILIPNPEGISHHVTSWISTHPVYVWQYLAFLFLAKIGRKLNPLPTPDDYLNSSRIHCQANLKPVTNLYQDEAIAYSLWMRKSLCGQENLSAAKSYLKSDELDKILPAELKLWEGGEFQEDYRIAVGYNSIDKNSSLDYDDIIDENYDELENLADRMLYEEWDTRNNIGMLTVVPVFIGLCTDDTTGTLHYEILNRSPRSVLSSSS